MVNKFTDGERRIGVWGTGGICLKPLSRLPLTGELLVHRLVVSWAANSALLRTTFPHGTRGTRLRFDCASGLTFLVKDQEKE